MKIGKCDVGFLGQETFNLEGRSQKCKFYFIKPAKEITEYINHHILLIDLSESMRDNIDNLKKGIKETLKALKKEENNYVSVILYSGDEKNIIARTVRCDDISYRMAKVYKIVDDEVYVRENTDLFKGFQNAKELIEELSDENVKQNIILFTDGYVASAEKFNDNRAKCLSVVEELALKNVSINTIGLGSYYDRSFLREISNLSYEGKFNHIGDIKSFYKTVLLEIKRINNTEKVNITIDNEEYYIISKLEMFKGETTLQTLDMSSNNIVVVFDDNLNINGKIIKPTRKKLLKEFSDDFSYSLARYYISKEDILNMEKAIKISEDLYVYNMLVNCYSFTEKGQAIEILDTMINDKSKRFKLGKSNIKSEEDEQLCLLELLQEIMNDNECKLLWNYAYKYKRIGVKEKSVEDEYKFIRPTVGFGNVKSINIGNERLNVGVKVQIDGVVQNEINKLKLDACIFRDYNIVVNGNINTDEIWCVLSKNAKSMLRKEKLIKSIIKIYDKEICVLNIKNLKVANKRISNLLTKNEVAKYLYDIEVLKCEILTLEKFIKDIFTTKVEEVLTKNDMEAIKVKQAFRVGAGNIYKPVKVEILSSTEYEFYISKVVDWKIEKFPKTKELKDSLERLKPLIVGDMKESYKRVLSKLTELKKEKSYKQNLINIVKISNRLKEKNIFNWDTIETKKKLKSDKELKANMIVGNIVNIGIKEIDGIKVREDYYEVIKKFN
ncbi:vWA domain-containing protein [uncultured Clostridium sp.]|uniref:vWA domain-containing protein n=1 Tax=uncultured Clostridium sp. TaxID=59620 RepID=UPI00260F35CF|nr:vWA domain-containing protein [uncultured Clostridium sp.]